MRAAAGNSPAERSDLAVLDFLRGVAALYVLAMHTVGLLWAGSPGLPPALAAAPDPLTALLVVQPLRWGHQAVLFFFLISGFCIHYRQAKQLAAWHPTARPSFARLLDARGYAARRCRRLYPTLLVVAVLTIVLDGIGRVLHPSLYAEVMRVADYSPVTWAGNVLFQGGLAVPVFGSLGPIWSLSFEFWFYLLYPALLWLTCRLGGRAMLGCVAALSVGSLLALPAGLEPPGSSNLGYSGAGTGSWVLLVFLYWGIWAAGALIAEAYAGRCAVPSLKRVGPGMLVALPVLAWQNRWVEAIDGWALADLLWGGAMAILLAYLLLTPHGPVAHVASRVARRLRVLGDISYALYLVHVPWLTCLGAWWLSDHAKMPRGFELVALGVTSSFALGALLWYLIEHWSSGPAASRAPRITPPRSIPQTHGLPAGVTSAEGGELARATGR